MFSKHLFVKSVKKHLIKRALLRNAPKIHHSGGMLSLIERKKVDNEFREMCPDSVTYGKQSQREKVNPECEMEQSHHHKSSECG